MMSRGKQVSSGTDNIGSSAGAGNKRKSRGPGISNLNNRNIPAIGNSSAGAGFNSGVSPYAASS